MFKRHACHLDKDVNRYTVKYPGLIVPAPDFWPFTTEQEFMAYAGNITSDPEEARKLCKKFVPQDGFIELNDYMVMSCNSIHILSSVSMLPILCVSYDISDDNIEKLKLYGSHTIFNNPPISKSCPKEIQFFPDILHLINFILEDNFERGHCLARMLGGGTTCVLKSAM
jgi:hypothetical protein